MPAEKDRPLSPEEAPDTARVYERARPEAEGGMGRLDNEKGTPTRGRNRMLDAAPNAAFSRSYGMRRVEQRRGRRESARAQREI